MSMNPVPAFLDGSSLWLREPGNRDDLREFLADNGVDIDTTFEIRFELKEMIVHYYLDTPRKLDENGEVRTGSRTVAYLTPSIPSIIP